MPPQARPRAAREESPHRKPFSAAPSPRSKYSFPVVNTPVLRRSRHNGENQPPDIAPNVKANSPFSEANVSPALHSNKSTSAKGKHHGSLSLPPRPLPPRPSPSTNHARSGHDSQGHVKRKLNLDSTTPTDALVGFHPPYDQDKASDQDKPNDLDNGVKVVIRLRPCNQKEEAEEATQIAEKISDETLNLADQIFTFDHVAGQDSSQQALFEMVGQPLVENCLQGFNSSIFAYGQTGSGKTYTMWGAIQDLLAQSPSEDRGLTPRVFECLFQRIKEEESKNADKQLRYQCRCSFLEIYNEQITDLLEPLQKALQVREDTRTGVYVENLTEEFVSTVSEVFHVMLKGLGNRKIASTSMNLESSRSHTLFTCIIESRCKSMSDGVSSVRTSRMNLVDLAGSERQKLTGAAGDRLKEAGNINRSLSQLGNVINILAEVSQTGKPRHIPYRDSRLTFLLQESLGGNAKLAIICAISPASSCKSESLSTLRFAQRAKTIQNKAVVNEETEDDVKILREQIRQLKDELMRMKSNETMSGGAGSYSTSWNARRSYNLLRMSLSRPLTLPHTDTDTDEEMEIDEDAVERADNLTILSAQPQDSGKIDLGVPPLEVQDKRCVSNTEILSSSFDKDAILNSSDSIIVKDAVTSSCLCLVQPPQHLDEKDGIIEAIHEEVCGKELLAQESSLLTQNCTEVEIGDGKVNDLERNDADESSCPDELLAPALQQELSESALEVQNNVCMDVEDTLKLKTQCETFEKPNLDDGLVSNTIEPSESALEVQDCVSTLKECHMKDEGTLKLEARRETSEKPDFDAGLVPNNILPVNFLLQTEDSDVCELAESPSKEQSRVIPECSINDCFSADEEVESSAKPENHTDTLLPVSTCKPDCSEIKMSAVSTDAHWDVRSDSLTHLDESQVRVDDAHIAVEDSQDRRPEQGFDVDNLINKIECLTAKPLEDITVNDLEQAFDQEEGPGQPTGGANCTTVKNAKERDLKSPVLSLSPHLASVDLDAPILSMSPTLANNRSQSFHKSARPCFIEDARTEACNLSYEKYKDAEEDLGAPEVEDMVLRTSLIKVNQRASQKLSSPTDRLAASLHRGLQIIENHQKKVCNTRISTVRFSFQKSGWDKPNTRSMVSQSVQTSLTCLPGEAVEHSESMRSDALLGAALGELNPERVSEELSTPERKADLQTHKNLEALLAGALRREHAMEEDLNRKTAEIEQLNRLIRQYKHERECNAVLQQSLEDKIARLESLMDGTLPTDQFLNEEWSSLLNEHKILQERYDHHPEVTLANIRQQRLYEDLEKYKSFCELGERDALLRELSQLRNQLQYYVELDTPKPKRQRQRSVTPQAKLSCQENGGVGESEPCDKVDSQVECPVESMGCQMCEKEVAKWTEQESEWMSVLDELRMEVEEYKQLAEKRKHEATGQQRCADEMKEALQMAMEGHARLLDQYAELQEKHIGLLAKHRKIRDAMTTARKKAGKMGFLGGGKWFEAQAAELIAVKLEREQEKKAAKEQIEGLQAQLRDTADAVQAAGELLVRLKEAEETVLIAQDAAALAAQDAERLYREIDKLKRRHSTEIATLQQRLLEARFQKSTLCPMCVMAERVKFEFTGVDGEEAEVALEGQRLAAEASAQRQSAGISHASLQTSRGELAEMPDCDEEFDMQGLDAFHVSEIDDKWYKEVQNCNF